MGGNHTPEYRKKTASHSGLQAKSGTHDPKQVATLSRNGWQPYSGISGKLGPEYAIGDETEGALQLLRCYRELQVYEAGVESPEKSLAGMAQQAEPEKNDELGKLCQIA